MTNQWCDYNGFGLCAIVIYTLFFFTSSKWYFLAEYFSQFNELSITLYWYESLSFFDCNIHLNRFQGKSQGTLVRLKIRLYNYLLKLCLL